MASTVTTSDTDSDSVELKKTSKGYTWTIKCYGRTISGILDNIDLLNKALQKEYGGETDEPQS